MRALPTEFKERIRCEIGDAEASSLFEALDGIPPVSIRFNPDKADIPMGYDKIPWSRYGYYMESRPQFTTDPAFHAGAYYVQEAGSQFVEYLLRDRITEGCRILDMCAAPGGKTTIYSTLAGRNGLVVANEYVRGRANILADNVRKWGVGNTVVTNCDAESFAGFTAWFDVVAVDAPCSGEGMFRKDDDAREQWSENNVRMCAERQMSILRHAWSALRGGGVLLYSTCTFNTVENEGVLQRFSDEFGNETESAGDIRIEPDWGITSGKAGNFTFFRFMPHRTKSEGFFVAIVRKSENAARNPSVPKPRKRIMNDVPTAECKELARWVKNPQSMRFASAGDTIYAYRTDCYNDVKLLAESLTVIYSGIATGQIFKGVLKPDWALSQYVEFDRSAVATSVLDMDRALDYLRKRDLNADGFADGMNLVTYDGMALGFAKRIGARINNMYPNSLRIINM